MDEECVPKLKLDEGIIKLSHLSCATKDKCKECGNELVEAPLNLVFPEVPEDYKGKYCIPCQKVYWTGTLDTAKRKAYRFKIE